MAVRLPGREKVIYFFPFECFGRMRYFAERGNSFFEICENVDGLSRKGLQRLQRYLAMQKSFEDLSLMAKL